MDDVDLRSLKEQARRLLPASNGYRIALLAEPDILPRAVAKVRLEMLLRLALALRAAP